MKTINKVILSIGTVALLTSGALAYGGAKGCDRDEYKSCHKMMKNDMHGKRNHIIKAIMQLDLTYEQRKEIKEILKDVRKSRIKPSEAFSETTFDKEKFVKILQDRQTNKFETRAETIEKVYAKLNATQKKNLKAILVQFEEKREKRMEGKNCQR
jgi:Spy/CpxP family protein refolding chaperone